MPIGEGYIRLYRKIGEWRWYDDKPTLILFIHLLITVNWKDEAWHDIMIRRGQRLCSLPILAKETGLSERSVRTAISHLKSTGEVTDTSTSKYRIITINNFEKYQDATGKVTGKRQASDRQATANEEDNNIYTLSKERVGQAPTPKKASMPPTLDEVTAYIGEKNLHIDPARFWNYYESNGWKVGKNPMKNWKAACNSWNTKDNPKPGAGKAASFDPAEIGKRAREKDPVL